MHFYVIIGFAFIAAFQGTSAFSVAVQKRAETKPALLDEYFDSILKAIKAPAETNVFCKKAYTFVENLKANLKGFVISDVAKLMFGDAVVYDKVWTTVFKAAEDAYAETIFAGPFIKKVAEIVQDELSIEVMVYMLLEDYTPLFEVIEKAVETAALEINVNGEEAAFKLCLATLEKALAQ